MTAEYCHRRCFIGAQQAFLSRTVFFSVFFFLARKMDKEVGRCSVFHKNMSFNLCKDLPCHSLVLFSPSMLTEEPGFKRLLFLLCDCPCRGINAGFLFPPLSASAVIEWTDAKVVSA